MRELKCVSELGHEVTEDSNDAKLTHEALNEDDILYMVSIDFTTSRAASMHAFTFSSSFARRTGTEISRWLSKVLSRNGR